jgi:hypothetical protein
MGRQKSRTLIEQLGFQDPDLRSPAHDALVLWIAEHIQEWAEIAFDPRKDLVKCQKQARAGLEKQFSLEKQFKCLEGHIQAELEELHKTEPQQICGVSVCETDQQVQARLTQHRSLLRKHTQAALAIEALQNSNLSLPDAPPGPIQIKTQLEVPIKTSREFIVGYVDVVAQVRYPELFVSNLAWRYRQINGTDGTLALAFRDEYMSVYLEAKPTIPSLGELLRQIRTYQEYVPKQYSSSVESRFVVVSPDVRYRKAIEDQGVEFWACTLV